MSERESKRDYSHRRANVPKRRTMYWAFLWTVIAVFVISLVDIIFLDEILYYGVLAAFGIIFVWGIILLFSRKLASEEEEEDLIEDEDEAETSDSDWRHDGSVEHLKCPACKHVFGFDMKHLDEAKEHVAFTCPECSVVSYMPGQNAKVAEAPIPGGAVYGQQFSCKKCKEEWSVGTIGHRGKVDVYFDACPHCHSTNIGRLES